MKKILLSLLVLLVLVCVGCGGSNPEPQPVSGKLYYEWRETELEYFNSFYVNRVIEGNFVARVYTFIGTDEIVPCSIEDYIEYHLKTKVYDLQVDLHSGNWYYHVFVQDYKGDWYSIIMKDDKEITELTKYSQN